MITLAEVLGCWIGAGLLVAGLFVAWLRPARCRNRLVADVLADRLRRHVGCGLNNSKVVVGHADVDGVASGVADGWASALGHVAEVTVSGDLNKVDTKNPCRPLFNRIRLIP